MGVMTSRMDTTPLLIQHDRPVLLQRIPLDERGWSEDQLQDLLFKHPSLIPINEIEPVFGPLIPIVRELATPSGPLDLLYMSPEGYPTLVETKLWRNPEARRTVVAQAIDYATQLSKWSYEELVQAVRKARADTGKADPFAELMASQEEWDQPHFIDTLSRNLRQGRLLLLIVGDGIHESVEQMAEMLAGTPQLGFTLALVEMAFFRPSDKPELLLVQPRIVARTREVVRAIVEVRGEVKPEQVVVKLPPEDKPAPGGRYRLSQEAFLERLDSALPPGMRPELESFLAEAEKLGVITVPCQASMSLHYIEPTLGAKFSFGYIRLEALVEMFYVIDRFQRAGLDDRIGREYLEAVARLVPGSKVSVHRTRTGVVSAIKLGKKSLQLVDLLRRKAEWLEAIGHMIERINQAADLGSQSS